MWASLCSSARPKRMPCKLMQDCNAAVGGVSVILDIANVQISMQQASRQQSSAQHGGSAAALASGMD